MSFVNKQHKYKDPFSSLIGTSAALDECKSIAMQIALLNVIVLLQGPSGTGKELFARAIHYASPRSQKPFVAINCGAISPHLIESEFFGHEKGAFTGASKGRVGYFETANLGTLFLDEIAELKMDMQAKLLRVFEQKEIIPVGSCKPKEVNIRIIAATNKNLNEAVQNGEFRQDLLYRIEIVPIKLPSLKARKEDIPLLAKHFIKKFCFENGIMDLPSIGDEVLTILKNYSWPGNVRELKNICKYAAVMVLAKGKNHIDISKLPAKILPAAQKPYKLTKIKRLSYDLFDQIHDDDNLSIKDIEDAMAITAYEKTNCNIKKAAAKLGISRSKLSRQLDYLCVK